MTDVEAQAIEGTALAPLRAVDPVLGRLIDAVGPFALQCDPSLFYALFSSIVSQHFSVRAAATIMSRIQALFPPGEPMTAAGVLALGAGPLRVAGLSGMKTRYVLDLSERAADGRLDLDRLATLDDEAVIAGLVQVKGIGWWTAEMFLIFALGRLDVLAVDDLGFRAAVKQQYGFDELPTADQLRTLGECWVPYRLWPRGTCGARWATRRVERSGKRCNFMMPHGVNPKLTRTRWRTSRHMATALRAIALSADVPG
jgi:3-methyladenine DNA glycosylase/8-oxoguanine DNA glycosylase